MLGQEPGVCYRSPMVTVTVERGEQATLRDEVDQDLTAFDVWFQTQGNEPLVNSEKAILRTYLWFKTRGKEGADTDPPPDTLRP